MTSNSWRRTAFESISGNVEIAPDDWTLLDPSGEPLARLYKVFGGPQDGRWYWTVLFRPDGSVGNGGNGFTATGRDAREACEARIPGNDASVVTNPLIHRLSLSQTEPVKCGPFGGGHGNRVVKMATLDMRGGGQKMPLIWDLGTKPGAVVW